MKDATARDMSNSASDVSDDFEFIETPAAPSPAPPATNCGVRTTAVSLLNSIEQDQTHHNTNTSLTSPPAVPRHQKRPPPRRRRGRRIIHQLPPRLPRDPRPRLPRLPTLRRPAHMALPRPLHLDPHHRELLGRRIPHVPAQKRKSAVPGKTRGALSTVSF